jgi:hypothetical protein
MSVAPKPRKSTEATSERVRQAAPASSPGVKALAVEIDPDVIDIALLALAALAIALLLFRLANSITTNGVKSAEARHHGGHVDPGPRSPGIRCRKNLCN